MNDNVFLKPSNDDSIDSAASNQDKDHRFDLIDVV